MYREVIKNLKIDFLVLKFSLRVDQQKVVAKYLAAGLNEQWHE